ncbi:MAG: hypothetical protein LUD27_02235 [Clostridia bacterium]|nr:hypothetical protein [Clostridia bacterium]
MVNGEIAEGFTLATEDVSANNGNTILIAILAVLAILVVAAVAICVAIFIKRRKHTIK